VRRLILFAGFLLLALLLSGCAETSDGVYLDPPDQVEVQSDDDLIPENTEDPEIEAPGSLFDQIRNGDLSNVVATEREPELLSILENHNRLIEEFGYEWIAFDLNGDGTNELILQAVSNNRNDIRRIVSIFVFDCEGKEVELVFHHNAGLRNPYFLSRNGNFIRAMHSFGPLISYGFDQYVFDDEWNTQWVQSLDMTVLYDLSQLGYEWAERNPDMAEVGLYFSKFAADVSDGERQVLDEHEFMRLFEEMTGSAFSDLADGRDVDNYRQLIERYNPSEEATQ